MRFISLFFVALIALSTLVIVKTDSDSESFANEDKKAEKPKYVKPVVNGEYYFVETFEENIIGKKWVKSTAKKDDVEEIIAKYDGQWSIESSTDVVLEGDKGLVLKSKAKHHAISSFLSKPFKFAENKPLVVQYEVKFQSPLECGGAYVKLLANEKPVKLEEFYDKTSFSIMFGPDKCGTENKYHFIVRHKNPVKGTYEEKHAKKSELPEAIYSDGKTHLYTLVVRPDNTYSMLIDRAEVNSGSLLNDLNPPINPPKEIVDPDDKKPESWDERERIADPDAVKPEDWDENEPKQVADLSAQMPDGWLEDEPATILDSSAVRPEDWDDETDGEWEPPKVDNPKCKNAPGCGKWSPPMIDNPKYKGKWMPPMIENPNYQGKWEPRKIANPDFFEDKDPFKSFTSFSAIGLELWSMTDQIYFDNFLITDDESVAEQFAQDTWKIKRDLEYLTSESSDNLFNSLVKATNDKPWLWAIYILVVLLPIVIVVVFCCTGKSKDQAKSDSKKTDEKTEDDPVDASSKEQDDQNKADQNEQEEEEEEEEDEDMANIDKSDLEEKPATTEEDNNAKNEEKETVTKRKNRSARKE